MDKFYVVRTAFHGGGIVSAHIFKAAAMKKMEKLICRSDCYECGGLCYGVVSEDEYWALPCLHDDAYYGEDYDQDNSYYGHLVRDC